MTKSASGNRLSKLGLFPNKHSPSREECAPFERLMNSANARNVNTCVCVPADKYASSYNGKVITVFVQFTGAYMCHYGKDYLLFYPFAHCRHVVLQNVDTRCVIKHDGYSALTILISNCGMGKLSLHPSACMGSFKILRPRQNGRYFADDIFKCIFLNENVWIPIEISLKFVPKYQIA